MWEITLIGENDDLMYFEHTRDILKSVLESDICIAIMTDKKTICSIATSDESQIDVIKTIIFETIIKVAKNDYFQENLHIFGNDQALNSFLLSSLVVIDLQDEIDFAFHNSKLSNIVNIKTFVFFKLAKLVKIWDKVINHINANFTEKMEDSIYLEFLKFLAGNTNNQAEIMYLEQTKDETQLLDNKKNTIRSLPKSDEIGIIVSLVMLAPKRLIINCIDLSTKVSDLISYIFEDRVSVLL